MEPIFSPILLIIISKLGLAMILGMCIGIERVVAHKTAGMRTYALVAMGAALFVVVSEMVGQQLYSGVSGFNPTMIAASTISGIGFLCAGLIIFKDSKLSGLTTATSIWVSAGIGMACGFGFYELALVATLLVLFVFVALWFIEEWIREIPEVQDHAAKEEGTKPNN